MDGQERALLSILPLGARWDKMRAATGTLALKTSCVVEGMATDVMEQRSLQNVLGGMALALQVGALIPTTVNPLGLLMKDLMP